MTQACPFINKVTSDDEE